MYDGKFFHNISAENENYTVNIYRSLNLNNFYSNDLNISTVEILDTENLDYSFLIFDCYLKILMLDS